MSAPDIKVVCEIDRSFTRVAFELPKDSEYRFTTLELPTLLRSAAHWLEHRPQDGAVTYQISMEITAAGDETETTAVALYMADLTAAGELPS